MSSYIVSYHHISYHIIIYRIIISYIIPQHIISYHIISYHIISYIISYHIISYHIISYHIVSYHIISFIERCFKVVAMLNVKAHGGVKLLLHSFLTSALDKGDLLAKVTLPPVKESYRLGKRLGGLQSP